MRDSQQAPQILEQVPQAATKPSKFITALGLNADEDGVSKNNEGEEHLERAMGIELSSSTKFQKVTLCVLRPELLQDTGLFGVVCSMLGICVLSSRSANRQF